MNAICTQCGEHEHVDVLKGFPLAARNCRRCGKQGLHNATRDVLNDRWVPVGRKHVNELNRNLGEVPRRNQ